ncbi:MAG: methyltransferase domain-containing protein [Bacteroidota bacterium]
MPAMRNALEFYNSSPVNVLEANMIKEIFEWDTYNWSRVLPFWNAHLKGNNLTCLELGARRGGPSLWLSLHGHEVLCTDIENPEEYALPFHQKHAAERISYDALDALNIPYENHFDVVVFKSILGGISRDGADANKEKVMAQIYKCLKPGGQLFFAENLEGSSLHKYVRGKTRAWGNSWNYLQYDQCEKLFSNFAEKHLITHGYFSAFGPNDFFKRILGLVDGLINPLLSPSKKYILFGVCKK